VLRVLEYHVDAFVLEDDFVEVDDVFVRQFRTELVTLERGGKGGREKKGLSRTAISRHADCDIPVYWITSPSLSGLNLGEVS